MEMKIKLIEVKNLNKYYGKHQAINNLSFIIKKNEIVGFLGPNGAGKTTTLNIITGYINQNSGDVIINNQPNYKLNTKRLIGYLPDTPPLYPDMKVKEYLNFVCELKRAGKNNLDDIMQKLKITDVKNKLIKNLSKGYKQRVGFAQALIGDPEILILDEPISGLDPKQIIEMRDLIKSLKQEHTVLISSHILSEIDAIADRVIIINKGQVVADDTPKELYRTLIHDKKIIARLKGGHENILASLYKNNYGLECVDYKKNIEDGTIDMIFIKKQNLDFDLDAKDNIENIKDLDIREKIFLFAKENNFILLMLKPFDISLEKIFLKLTSDQDNINNINQDFNAINANQESEKNKKEEE